MAADNHFLRIFRVRAMEMNNYRMSASKSMIQSGIVTIQERVVRTLIAEA